MNTAVSTSSVVAVYPTHTAAEAAVKALQTSGFDMKQLSIVGRDHHLDEHVVGYYNIGDRMKLWAGSGAFWGGLWGMMFGSAFFWIPAVGPLLVAGPLVGWLVSVLEGAALVGGVSAIGAALYSVGIPKDSVLRYETALKTGSFVLVARGNAEQAEHARDILAFTPNSSLDHHALAAQA
jgi:uncharacterized membrane protein